MNEATVLDWPTLLAMRGWQELGERDVVEELLEIFLADLEVHLAGLRSAHESGDYRMIARISHRVRGSASVIGADQMYAAASALESAARTGGGPAVAARLDALVVAGDAVRAAWAAREGA